MKTKIRSIAILLAAAIAALCISGCSMKLSVDDPEDDNVSDLSESALENESTSTRKARVSVIQYADYSSLNECREGVEAALNEAGIGFEVTVGSKNHEKDDCEQKAQDLAINSATDLIVCIGTPCAEIVCPIISSAGRTPVVFCAVTDPVGAGIVENIASPGVNCTGVATAFNIKEQLNMINTFQPSITKLGVIYTESEQNTKGQLESLKKAAQALGITVYAEPVEDPSQLSPTAKSLMTKVEAVTILPDNMIAMNSWNITNQSIVGKIPLYGVNLSQVHEGCLAGYCYDFTSIGKKAGEQAIQILHGESAADMPVIMERECTLYVNSDRLSDLDMTIPDEYKTAANEVKTQYETSVSTKNVPD